MFQCENTASDCARGDEIRLLAACSLACRLGGRTVSIVITDLIVRLQSGGRCGGIVCTARCLRSLQSLKHMHMVTDDGPGEVFHKAVLSPLHCKLSELNSGAVHLNGSLQETTWVCCVLPWG